MIDDKLLNEWEKDADDYYTRMVSVDLKWDGPEKRIVSLISAIRATQKQLRFCAGYISATSGHTHKHPQEVLEWIEEEAEK